MRRRRGDTNPDWLVRLNDDNLSMRRAIVGGVAIGLIITVIVLAGQATVSPQARYGQSSAYAQGWSGGGDPYRQQQYYQPPPMYVQGGW